MDFAEKMCDHVAMIDHGKIIVNGPLAQLNKIMLRKMLA